MHRQASEIQLELGDSKGEGKVLRHLASCYEALGQVTAFLAEGLMHE